MKKNKVLIPFLVVTLVFSTAWFVVPTPDAHAQVVARKIRLFAGFKLSIVKTKLKVAQIEAAPAGGGGDAPTVTTNANAIATGTWLENHWMYVGGNITSIGGDAPTVRGFAFGTNCPSLDNLCAATTTEYETFGTGAFLSGSDCAISSSFLFDIYYRAYATNSFGTGYGTIESDTPGGVNSDCAGGA